MYKASIILIQFSFKLHINVHMYMYMHIYVFKCNRHDRRGSISGLGYFALRSLKSEKYTLYVRLINMSQSLYDCEYLLSKLAKIEQAL